VGGAVSGLLAGLLGIGGALVSIPVLHWALPALGIDVSQVSATAVATALMAMVPMTLLATWRQKQHGALETDWLRRIAFPTALGAAGGALLAAALNGPVLALLFAMQSLWYGTGLLGLHTSIASSGGGVIRRLAHLPPWLAVPPMAAFCGCVGMGGGSLLTPFLLAKRVPFRHAVATAGALNLCIALGGSAAFFVLRTQSAGTVACMPAALCLAAGAMASVMFGVSLSHRISPLALQRLIGTVNVVSAATLVGQVTLH
jgi:uncharacterized membrane protein YfcA